MAAKRAKQLARGGENFQGLKTFIISEIDSGSDDNRNAKSCRMSDASSFSNSDGEQGAADREGSSSDADGEEREKFDVIFGAASGLLPNKSKILSRIWE